jgi:NAD kinase
MIVTKPGDDKLVGLTAELTRHILSTYAAVHIYVADNVLSDPAFKYNETNENTVCKQKPESDSLTYLHTWSSEWTCEAAGDSKTCRFSVSKSSESPQASNKSPDNMQWRYHDLRDDIDLVITLGGDGTLLYVSMLFQKWVPPVVSFDLGSLGFLTPFSFVDHKKVMKKVLKNKDLEMNLRIRVHCGLYRKEHGQDVLASGTGAMTKERSAKKGAVEQSDGNITKTNDQGNDRKEDKSSLLVKTSSLMGSMMIYDDEEDSAHVLQSYYSFSNFTPLFSANVHGTPNSSRAQQLQGLPSDITIPDEEYRVLNEVVVDRGSSASLVELDLYADGEHFTTYLADGIVVATSTGSTAYSVCFLVR